MSNLKALTAWMTVHIKGQYQTEQKHDIKTGIGIIMHMVKDQLWHAHLTKTI